MEDAGACCRRCAEVPECTHWSFMKGGACQLKQGKLTGIKAPKEMKVIFFFKFGESNGRRMYITYKERERKIDR
jgi:hypothetical protein